MCCSSRNKPDQALFGAQNNNRLYNTKEYSGKHGKLMIIVMIE